MLPKPNRLRSSRDFSRVYQGGRAMSGPWFTLRFRSRSNGSPNRVGIVVGTKVSKKSVERNTVRRRIREAIRATAMTKGKGFDVVVIAKQQARGRTLQQMVHDMHGAVQSIDRAHAN